MDNGEDVGGCDGAGTDDRLSFVLKVIVIFLLETDFVVGENVVEYVGLAFGFPPYPLLESALLTFSYRRADASERLKS